MNRVLAIGLVFIGLIAGLAKAEERLSFIGVALDRETQEADQKLQDYLYRKADVSFAPENLEYGQVIERLSNWKPAEGPFVARTTPYVLVAAEMLGAELEPLATYMSAATGQTTYHSYLVVNRQDFPTAPDLSDVIRFVTNRRDPARFIYHSKFSTSSFFLPSLNLRSHKIFHMPESTDSLTAIASQRISENSSSRLVELVAEGEAELAAVWDGTKAKFEAGAAGDRPLRFGSKVHFVQLPTALPNDLLVCSRSLDQSVKDRLVAAIREMSQDEIGVGDFRTWTSIREATEARLALAELRWLAQERVAPVTVDVRSAGSMDAAGESPALLEAARQAVRLSGTEFVLYDKDYHEHIDFVWALELIHDGAVTLRSSIPGSEVEEQVFRISFQETEDLTRRIVSLAHSRMHRIRYAWPYSNGNPTVIRDMAFSMPVGSQVKVQRISWLDPERNKFRGGPLFDARIRQSGFFKYELEANDFPEGRGLELDAMSNISYRVLLLRTSKERTLFRVLSLVFVLLLVIAAVTAGLSLRRPKFEESSIATTATPPP